MRGVDYAPGCRLITPHNVQVFEMQHWLHGAPVGTVDKFQGQEAPIATYSTEPLDLGEGS